MQTHTLDGLYLHDAHLQDAKVSMVRFLKIDNEGWEIGVLLGGMQLAAIGIIGEYIGRIFDEVKHRPLYIIKERLDENNAEQRASDTTEDGQDLNRKSVA